MKVTLLPLKAECPFYSITGDRKVTAVCVVMQMSLFGQQRRTVAGSPGERAGTLGERVADILHRQNVVDRAATLCQRVAALSSLHGRAAPHVRPGVGALCERAGGTVDEKTRHVAELGTQGLGY